MKRRKFITLLAGTAAAWPSVARAQQDDRVRALLHRILRLQAENAAANIRQFIKEIESQVGWTTQLPWSVGSIEQRRTDSQRLLRQVPAIMEIAQLDPAGIEQLRVSRLAIDVVGSKHDYSRDPKFTEAVANQVHYGPVYFFRRESREPRQDEFRESDALSGLGMAVTLNDGLIKVVSPIENMPAAKAGIMSGDIITELDDEPVRGLTLGQVIEKIRGPANTKIKLTIMRKGHDIPIELSITRDVIRESSRVSRGAPVRQPEPSRPEPYMTLSLAGTRRDAGVSVAEVSLKLIQDMVSATKVGEHGQAYAIDAQGRLIAHSDISLVVSNTDMTQLPQVWAVRTAGAGAGGGEEGKDILGRDVFTAYAPVVPLGWLVFVELPAKEANAPLDEK
jgi:PDZ domain